MAITSRCRTSLTSSKSQAKRKVIERASDLTQERCVQQEEDRSPAAVVVGPTRCPVVQVVERDDAPSQGESDSGSNNCSTLSYVDRVIMELIETERTYVKDLDEIIKGYLKHMRSVAKKEEAEQQPNNSNKSSSSSSSCARLTSDQIEEFFGNLEDVYNFSRSFLSQLETCGLDPVAIARCFVQKSSGFEVYAHYCTVQYPKMLCLLMKMMSTKETADLLKERQVALNHSLPVGSYLLKPVQRILKYPLLLQNIVKHTDSAQEGSAEIQEALTVVINYAFYINDKKREHEQAVRVQEMQRNLAIKRKKKELKKQIKVPLKKAIQCILHLISCTSPQISK